MTSATLTEILSVADDKRDVNWENQFFHVLSQGNLKVLIPEPHTGPDGWPYLLADTTEEPTEDSFQRVLHWLSDKGIGLVVNPQKEYPDYVFTYGMLWNFKETGLFFKKSESVKEGFFEFQLKEVKSAGEPSAQYLPKYVRAIVKEFLLQQGVIAPKILAFTLDGAHFDLAFSKESLGDPDSSEHQGLLEALAWFFPLHYNISLLSEKELTVPFVIL